MCLSLVDTNVLLDRQIRFLIHVMLRIWFQERSSVSWPSHKALDFHENKLVVLYLYLLLEEVHDEAWDREMEISFKKERDTNTSTKFIIILKKIRP